MEGLLTKLKRELEIRNLSKQTIKGYSYSVGRFLEFSSNKGLNEEAVRNYIQANLENKNPSSVRRDLFAIKFFFDNVLNKKMWIEIKYSKTLKKIPSVLTKDEIRKLLNSIENREHRLMIEFLYGSGLRASELLNTKVKDLDLGKCHGYVRKGKEGKDRLIIVPKIIREKIKNLIEKGYDIINVQSLLGHKSPETTLVYTHIASPNLINTKSPLETPKCNT